MHVYVGVSHRFWSLVTGVQIVNLNELCEFSGLSGNWLHFGEMRVPGTETQVVRGQLFLVDSENSFDLEEHDQVNHGQLGANQETLLFPLTLTWFCLCSIVSPSPFAC